MIPAELDDQTKGKIIERQSTFLRFVTPDFLKYKIDYVKKKEFLIDELSFRGVQVVTVHPLLVHYEQPILDIYISSKAENSSDLAKEFSDMVSTEFGGWRTMHECFNPQCSIESILAGGYGLLYRGPNVLGQKVISKLEKNGIKFSSGLLKVGPIHIPKVLLLGANAIVAEDFHGRRDKS